MLRFLGLDATIDLYRELGPLRFFVLLAGFAAPVLGIMGLQFWLAGKIGWPEAYGFRCHGRGCWIDDLIHSPRLLHHAKATELGLFATIWFVPTLFIALGVWGYAKRRRRERRDRILPMDD